MLAVERYINLNQLPAFYSMSDSNLSLFISRKSSVLDKNTACIDLHDVYQCHNHFSLVICNQMRSKSPKKKNQKHFWWFLMSHLSRTDVRRELSMTHHRCMYSIPHDHFFEALLAYTSAMFKVSQRKHYVSSNDWVRFVCLYGPLSTEESNTYLRKGLFCSHFLVGVIPLSYL